jgi:hypothetical protein
MELLGQFQNDPLRSTEVAEFENVIEIYDLAQKFGTVLFHSCHNGFDIFNGKANVSNTQTLRRIMLYVRFIRRTMKFYEFQILPTVRRSQHCICKSRIAQARYLFNPGAYHIAFLHRCKTKIKEKGLHGGKIVYDYAHMIHSANFHIQILNRISRLRYRIIRPITAGNAVYAHLPTAPRPTEKQSKPE